MKVALLISGYQRSFHNTYENLKKFILDKIEDIDVYLHLTKNENDDKYTNKKKYDLNKLISLLDPKYIVIDDNHNFNEDLNLNNLLNQWYKYYK